MQFLELIEGQLSILYKLQVDVALNKVSCCFSAEPRRFREAVHEGNITAHLTVGFREDVCNILVEGAIDEIVDVCLVTAERSSNKPNNCIDLLRAVFHRKALRLVNDRFLYLAKPHGEKVFEEWEYK